MIDGYNMKLEDLKLFALFYIKESDNLSNKEKISLMEYVDKVGESEILFLLATGCTPDNYVSIEESNGVAYRIQEVARVDLAARLAVRGITAMKGEDLLQTYKSYDPTNPEQAEEKPWGHSTRELALTAFNALANSIAYKMKKKYVDKNMQKCEKEIGVARKACHNKIRKDAIRAQIVALSSMKVKCRKTKNFDKCTKDIDAQIKNLQNKMNAIKVF